ncbi:hypothetical protein J6TS1_48840 [Siminovitchia terrae]|uniref:Uncharacterized protein n=1 Tax=Siminovitchia terrae TaxID=1914933 RepID=A0ABQ4L501_SIMTE|nr:hypothetical protein [Siminovitchia terrae]GIN99014.1 hypothetical protein J6TS1_48840 [Siminovitchia terrae]
MAEVTFENCGAPKFDGKAIELAQEIQKNLGLEPMERPFLDEIEQIIEHVEA